MTPTAVVTTLRQAGVVFAEDEATLLLEAATDPSDLAARVARRCAGEPLELVVGWAAFDGWRVPVASGVFVPRRRSEALVETADRLLGPGRRTTSQRPVVLDLCCGTGALGVSLARRLKARGVVVDLVLSDLDARSTRAAGVTVRVGRTTGRVVTGDLLEPVPAELRGRVDVLLANVPYVPSDAVALLPREARDHEPRASLDGGADGLDVLRRAASALDWLAPGGCLLTEATAAQAPAAAGVLERAGVSVAVSHDDERDVSVVVAALRDT